MGFTKHVEVKLKSFTTIVRIRGSLVVAFDVRVGSNLRRKLMPNFLTTRRITIPIIKEIGFRIMTIVIESKLVILEFMLVIELELSMVEP